jgi:hypothetical protein
MDMDGAAQRIEAQEIIGLVELVWAVGVADRSQVVRIPLLDIVEMYGADRVDLIVAAVDSGATRLVPTHALRSDFGWLTARRAAGGSWTTTLDVPGWVDELDVVVTSVALTTFDAMVAQ